MIAPATLDDLLAALEGVAALLVTNPISCKVGLIGAPFNPSIDLRMADLTICAQTGLEPIAGVPGPQNESIDVDTGRPRVDVKVPAGGFRWETPVGFTGPLSVYGYALGNRAFTVLYATHLLGAPIILTAVNEAITAPRLQFPTNLVPTRELLLQVQIHTAWMPTVWGWVDEDVPTPPLTMTFNLLGDGTGKASILTPIAGPPANSPEDIAAFNALFGPLTLIWPAPDCAPLVLDEEFDGLAVDWNPVTMHYEYFLFPR